MGNNYLTLNGTGVGGEGALCNVQDSNSFAGCITLNSPAEVSTPSGTLTLTGALQGGYDLTKAGTGTLVMGGVSELFRLLNVAEGTLTAENSLALGSSGGLGATVSDGATLAVQGGSACQQLWY